MNNTKVIKLGLVPKLIISIILGIIIGYFFPTPICRTIFTLSGLFSTFLKFIIPLMILGYVTIGIANLSHGAGLLLFVTLLIAYFSTLIAGITSFMVSFNLFPQVRSTLTSSCFSVCLVLRF